MRISLLLLGLLPLAVADIYSCGGFVKSSVAINYQNVKVKLLSPEGHLKSEEDCNPQNGYYMIPVYNKGKYSLKVSAPEGWHFEKDTVEINIDGETDPCSKNEDVNFVVEAFSITGTLDDGNGKGQAGIDLVLKQNGNIVQKTVTGNDGKYSFKAKPGKYEVSTSDSTDACIARKAVQVSVVDKPVVVQPSLSISGYSLSINVKNKGKGVAGVPITVFASNSKLSNCVALKTPVNGATHSCSVGKTSTDGSLQISCLPFGKYRAVAKWDQEGTHFTFAPAEADFEISNAKKSVDFTVSGFSARGRVVSAGGQPLEGVTVKTSSGQTVTTDKKGYYELSLQEGQLELKASAPHTQFTTVSAKIQLPTVQIPDISVDSYEVCGNVEKSGASYERLILSKKGSSDSVSIQPSGDGSFCKFVKVGTYTISPADSSSSLTPRSLEVDVNKGPVEGLRFTHFKTDADARVTCIGNCGPITLVLSMGNTVVQRKEGADVTFQDIGPGQYTVKLEDGGRGCWENKELTLTVERSSPPAIHFVQSGLVTNVKLSHKAHLKWTHADKKQIRGELDAVAGVNSICVPVQGQYNIEIKSCYTFSPASLEVSVPTETIVEAKATDAQISGTVKGGDNTMIIKVKSSSGERDIPVQNGVFTFRESLLSADQILLVPSSPVYLFEPQSHSIAFHGDCLEKAAHFDAQKGIFIDGKIQPPVKDVKITAVNNRDKNVELKAISDAYGHFRLGPVRKAEDLTITALLDGYSFTPKAGKIGVIDSVKLSKLTVVLTDSVSHERLEDVLLSLVGGSTGYRSNSKVESNGEINFVGLAPGEYFVRPILQEYKFEPSTHTISVKEGEHQHLTLEGKRVSYSVYGKVREMSKAPVTGVPVEALSEQCEQHQSEAVTGQDGQFRIRGLRPGCSYRVSTKHTAGASNVHCFPSSFTVSMPSADVKGLEMVAAPQDRSTMVAVEIDFGTMIQPTSYKVSVTRSGNVVAQQVITAPVTVFHYEMNRDGAEYSVRVEADRPHNAFKAKTVIFTADSPVRVVRVPITASTSKDHVEISLGSFLALPFFGILALIFLNQNKALEIVRDLYQQYKNGSASPATERKRRRM